MAIMAAKAHLAKYGFEDRVIEYEQSTATVSQAACAVGCTEGEIAKTLSFIVEDKPIVIVVAGDAKIDNAKYKTCFRTKAKMIPFEIVEDMTGHCVGGVCPFGVKAGVSVYLDVSLKEYDIVYPACGSSNSAVKLSIDELYRVSECVDWVDVCKK